MDFYLVSCIILCVVSGSSTSNLRIRRQMWHDTSIENRHLHFPEHPVPERVDSDEFNNDVFGFPDIETRPVGMGPISFRPRPTSSSNQWSNGNKRPSGGNGQIPDFNNNPWLNGIGGQSGNNNQRPNNGNGQQTQSSTTPSVTTGQSSTPRTFHLAPEGCDCPSTPQFNPVCGSDGNTYKNSGLLKCFRLCGIDVTQRRMGAC